MKLYIDGTEITPRPEQSLYEIVDELGLLSGSLATDPIAAKIAGRVFTLHYVPLRQKDLTPDRTSMRKAMAASEGVVKLLRYTDPEGHDVYTRTAQVILFLASRRLWPAATAKMTCTVGTGMYIRVSGVPAFSVERLRREVETIVAADTPLRRHRIPTAEAIAYFASLGQHDKARLFAYRQKDTVDISTVTGTSRSTSTGSWPLLRGISAHLISVPPRRASFSSTPTAKTPTVCRIFASNPTSFRSTPRASAGGS